jgi:hypothetical protein
MQTFEQAMKVDVSRTIQEVGTGPARQEKPILRLRNGDGDDSASAYCFGSIDEVPSAVLSDVILGVLRRYGQTTDEELIKTAARELGFLRVGRRIAARIGRRVTDLIAARKVRRADGDRLCAS